MSSNPNKRNLPTTITLLDRGCEFNGKLSFEGVVRIDGVFQGEIYSQDHLIIGEGAVVEANLQVGQLEISGSFMGDIRANEKLIVHSTGRINGKIQTRELEVHRGAQVDGQIEMNSLREVSDSKTPAQETILHFKRPN
ncbi:MAG: polymer-forming cytoskeletal protein [Deltaproteobacteria bacterium]|nr:polymer-forming cytoskeletal protein [Deltaproteobacteria bacterium]